MGEGRCHRARSWVFHVPGRDGRREKMVNKHAAIVYVRLNASMVKQKKNLCGRLRGVLRRRDRSGGSSSIQIEC